MKRIAIAVSALALTLVGCETTTDRSPTQDPTPGEPTGYGTGSMEDAIRRMKAMRSAMTGALDQALGERTWTAAANQDGATISGCNRPGYETVSLRIQVADRPITDQQWQRAADIVERVGRDEGFDVVKTVVDQPGRHELTGLAPDGGSYALDTNTGATLRVQTGCYRWDSPREPDAWQTIDPVN